MRKWISRQTIGQTDGQTDTETDWPTEHTDMPDGSTSEWCGRHWDSGVHSEGGGIEGQSHSQAGKHLTHFSNQNVLAFTGSARAVLYYVGTACPPSALSENKRCDLHSGSHLDTQPPSNAVFLLCSFRSFLLASGRSVLSSLFWHSREH